MNRPRLHDDKYLAWLREQPCSCGCGLAAPSDPAHVRMGFRALGKKPDDIYCLPLNRECHRLQHEGEGQFWALRGRDPFEVAARYYAEFGGDGGAPRAKRKTVKPRKPKEQRARFPKGRGFQRRVKA